MFVQTIFWKWVQRWTSWRPLLGKYIIQRLVVWCRDFSYWKEKRNPEESYSWIRWHMSFNDSISWWQRGGSQNNWPLSYWEGNQFWEWRNKVFCWSKFQNSITPWGGQAIIFLGLLFNKFWKTFVGNRVAPISQWSANQKSSDWLKTNCTEHATQGNHRSITQRFF